MFGSVDLVGLVCLSWVGLGLVGLSWFELVWVGLGWLLAGFVWSVECFFCAYRNDLDFNALLVLGLISMGHFESEMKHR